MRNGVGIIGATNNTYTLVQADAGAMIICKVLAVNAADAVIADSICVYWAALIGGAFLLDGEANGFATDFLYPADALRVALKASSVLTNYGLDGFYQNAGTSPKQVWDVNGMLGWSPHSLQLRSEGSQCCWLGKRHHHDHAGAGHCAGWHAWPGS